MEITMLSLSFTFILMVISLCVTSLWYRGKQTAAAEDTSRIPPGKLGWPIIGETFQFVRFAKRGNPEKFTSDRMKMFSTKVFKTSLINQNMAVFCGASGNKFLFTNSNELSGMWWPKSISKLIISQEAINTGDDLEGKQIRKLTQEFLNPEFIQQKLVDVMDHTAKQHFKKICTSQQVRVLELSKRYTFHLACRLFLSLDDLEKVNVLAKLFQDIIDGFTAIPLNFPGTTFHRASKSSCIIRKEIMSIIKLRKLQMLANTSDGKKDMLSQLLDTEFREDGEFPKDAKIRELILACLVAGTDTVATTMTCMVMHMTELPDVYAQVVQEQMEIAKCKKLGELLNWEDIKKMKYTWCVANETMRLSPPGQGGFRKVVRDVTYAGFTIPKGWKAHWTVHSTNRNSEYFKNPDEFNPSRFEGSGPPPFTFVPFGGGFHICPGSQYAKIAVLTFIHNLVTHFHFERILPNEKITYALGATPVKGLPIRIYPRNGRMN